jgi:hypothetical protein
MPPDLGVAKRCPALDMGGEPRFYVPETERSWAPDHHKEFSMTTTHFDQLQLANRWRTLRTVPKYIRLPGKVIYRLCDIEAYENECLV